jgi:hypothetical protein
MLVVLLLHGLLGRPSRVCRSDYSSLIGAPDPRMQVGAVIVGANKVVLGIGYNGFPRWVGGDRNALCTICISTVACIMHNLDTSVCELVITRTSDGACAYVLYIGIYDRSQGLAW